MSFGCSAFLRHRGGNFHVLTAVLAIPILVGVGLSVDYARYLNGQAHLQQLADAATLAMAASKETDEAKLRAIGTQAVTGNLDNTRAHDVKIADFQVKDQVYTLELTGNLPTTFMRLANTDYVYLSGRSVAERSVEGSVEVALVLDTTYSMSDTDAKGVRKIDALKSSATELVRALFANAAGSTKIALVPYADYVNVGTSNRSASWLSVPADYSTTKPGTCTTYTTKTVCLERAPKRTCTKDVDGVEVTYSCGNECTRSETQEVEPYQSCSKESTTYYEWYGCIGSRMTGNSRLDDKSPSVTYPGYLDVRQKCPTPIVALTNNSATIETAITDLKVELPSYQPLTYIPAGLVWGVNVLSPTRPFEEGGNYDARNTTPRKVMVLMTDGENTLRYVASSGKHTAFSGNATQIANQQKQTHQDGLSICQYAKDNKIEIFTIAFSVDSEKGKELMAQCATDADHYFDATDSTELSEAFANIASSLARVRLTQ